MPTPDPNTTVLRAPMRSRTRDVAAGTGAEFGIRRGVVGIGEPLETHPGSLAEAVYSLTAAHGEKAGRMLARFAALDDGALVWTRTRDGAFWLGRLAGPWRYGGSPDAQRLGIVHVRATDWLPAPVSTDEVPASVSQTFARGGLNLQQIRDPDAAVGSLVQWQAARSVSRS